MKLWWGGLPEARENKYGKAMRPQKHDTTICLTVGSSACFA
jgi:hypothetical protein